VDHRVELNGDLLRLVVDDLDSRIVREQVNLTDDESLSLTLADVRSTLARKLAWETGTLGAATYRMLVTARIGLGPTRNELAAG